MNVNENPLLQRWSGPHGGTPPLDKVRASDFEPALAAAMDAFRREVAAITESAEPPTFANTIAAFEDAGRSFGAVSTLFGIWSSSMNDAAFQAVELRMAPILSAFSDELTQNPALFARIEAVYTSPARSSLTPEQQRLVWLHHTRFVRAGARLDAAGKKRVAEMNQRLATLYTEFSQNVLADEEGYVVALSTEADLAGLPDAVREGAAAAAEALGMKGKWAITNTRSSMEPFLTYSSRRDLREKIWNNYVSRGDNGDAHDNNARITEILALRAERATLLGYATHAHWRLEDSMAGTPGARHGPPGGGVEARRAPGARGGRRHAGHRRRGGQPASPSPRGTTATTRRRSARRSTTSTKRDQALPAAGEAPRRACSGSPGSSSASPSRPRPACPVQHPDVQRLRGHAPGHRRARGALVLRPLRARGQALGRVDERVPEPGALPRRGDDHRLQQRSTS